MALRYRGRVFSPSRRYQPRDDQARTIAHRHEVRLRTEMRAAFHHLRELVPVDDVAKLIRAHRYHEAAHLIKIDGFKSKLNAPFNVIGDIFDAAGHAGADQISTIKMKARLRRRMAKGDGLFRPAIAQFFKSSDPIAKDTSIEDRFTFNRFDPGTQEKLRGYQDDLIQQLDTNARDSIERAILTGVKAADTPEEIAANIRDTITLTDTQAQAVTNYRLMLEDLDPTALQRQLRNSSYDPQIQDAIDSGEFLDADVIDQMVEDYADNYLDYRADTIAGTESMRAANLGLHEAYSQAIDDGQIPAEAVTRVWLIDLDEKTCPICLSIPDQNPDGVAVDEQFQSDDGPIDDAPVHPSCRCSVQYETNLDLVPG